MLHNSNKKAQTSNFKFQVTTINMGLSVYKSYLTHTHIKSSTKQTRNNRTTRSHSLCSWNCRKQLEINREECWRESAWTRLERKPRHSRPKLRDSHDEVPKNIHEHRGDLLRSWTYVFVRTVIRLCRQSADESLPNAQSGRGESRSTRGTEDKSVEKLGCRTTLLFI